jgi:hypothetical protein
MRKRAKNYRELKFLLDGQVEQFTFPLPIQTQCQVLPLGELTWENFERLCARLITKDGAIFDCYRYGKPGEEQEGIDILSRRWVDGHLEKWVYQCKRYSTFTVTNVKDVIASFKFEADVYVILLSRIASAEVRGEVAKHPNIQLWDQEDISRKLKDHPAIVADFFSRQWQMAFSETSGKPPADSTQAAIRQAIGLDLNHVEWLHSNLLPVIRLPEKIYKAPAPLRPSSATTAEELAQIPPYKLSREQHNIWSLANLKEPDVASLMGCDPDHISFEPVEHFISWHAGRNIIRDLFYEHLRRKCVALGMAYDEEHHRFYFTPLDGNPRIKKYNAYKRRASRQLAYPYLDKETEEVRFWVHQAVRFTLLEIDPNYYLRVEPAYAFTKDGYEFMASEDIGPLSTRRKSGERNQNVFNHLIFWRSILLDPATGSIRVDCEGQEFVISTVYESAKANFGIPFDSQPIEEIALTEDEFDLEMMAKGEFEDAQDSE